ncbi:Carboxylesterase [Phaeosphaeria sp. MPI-PUGE-AT-0046c]|nr:Carboxylesterase [Phaeosphaeria sp. MPI-PUGE-AT-0046c]
MLRSALFIALLAAGQRAAAQGADVAIDLELTAATTSGIYTGFVDDAVPNVKQWLGIRYANPPIGSKRFMPPEAAVDNSTHYYARDYKPVCFQQSGSHTGLFWELVPEFQNQDPQGEDCLFLNVWAPKKPVVKKVPVLIWVCGGGQQEGGGHAPYQVPDHWVERMKNHIVVTFNYRLNVFGFPGARAARENVGFHDARLVVEWARDNIAAFGGDPENMIIWGQSAGAGVVGSYIYANGQDPIVSGAIAMSGAVNNPPPDNSSKFTTLAGAAGCGSLSAEDELSCMQNVPALRLQDLVQGTTLPGTNTTAPRFGAVIDNITVFANNTDRLAKNLTAKIPLMTGYTTHENSAFGGYISRDQTAPPPGFSTAPGPSLGCAVQAEIT